MDTEMDQNQQEDSSMISYEVKTLITHINC